MKPVTGVFVLALVAICQARMATAQTIPNTFNDLQFLVSPGDRITVVSASGVESSGRIAELGASTLSIETPSGERRFNQDDVIVIRQRKADTLMNGVLIGAAIGGGLGLAAEISCGWNEDYCGVPGAAIIGGAIWGVGIGAFADALQKTQRDVFRHGPGTIGTVSVSPVVGRHAAGAQVAFRW
jgi:hypothetical protein